MRLAARIRWFEYDPAAIINEYSEYFEENVHMFDALDFLAELTQHIPLKRTQLIRRCGLYSSRTKGRWDQMEYIADRAPAGWREARVSESDPDNLGYTPLSETQEVDSNARKRAWARLIAGPLLWAVY